MNKKANPKQQTKTAPKKPSSLEKLKPYGIGGGIVIVLILFVVALTQKPQGGPWFGICKTFVELQVPYPTTLKFTEVNLFQYSAQLYYTFTDAFGSRQSQLMECGYEVTDNQVILKTALLNRREVDPDIVEKFNETVGIVMLSEPDTTLPPRNDGSIKNLKN